MGWPGKNAAMGQWDRRTKRNRGVKLDSGPSETAGETEIFKYLLAGTVGQSGTENRDPSMQQNEASTK